MHYYTIRLITLLHYYTYYTIKPVTLLHYLHNIVLLHYYTYSVIYTFYPRETLLRSGGPLPARASVLGVEQ